MPMFPSRLRTQNLRVAQFYTPLSVLLYWPSVGLQAVLGIKRIVLFLVSD